MIFFTGTFCSHNHPPKLAIYCIIVTRLASTAEPSSKKNVLAIWRALSVEKGLNFKIKFFVHTCVASDIKYYVFVHN